MASPQQERLTPKQQALHDLEYARASLAHHAVHAAEEWSPKAIITRSFHKHRAVWIGAAAIAGLAVLKAVWPSGGSHSRHDSISTAAKSSALSALLLGPLVALARKSLMSYGAQWLETYLHQKISPNAPDAGGV
jgi:sensor c-di-GMP phosphodiesterase-like protein